MDPQDRTVEEKLAEMATKEWGVVSWRELMAAGISATEAKRRADKGLLIRMHRGVYRVGHTAPSIEATYLAAVKACGEGAVLCGRAAAYLQGLLPKCRRPPPPEVMCPTERRVEGIRTKRVRRIDKLDVTKWKGIPATSVARTLVDLAALLDDAELARACHEAGVKYRTTPAHVKAALARHPNARGAAKLRRIMSGDTRVTLSKLESGFLERLREARLPLPITNKPAGGKRIDCRWPKHKVTVELESYAFHNSRHSWEQSLIRERQARKRGDEFCRYGWSDVFEDPRDMLRELRELLAS
jgi:hypothetical protein